MAFEIDHHKHYKTLITCINHFCDKILKNYKDAKNFLKK